MDKAKPIILSYISALDFWRSEKPAGTITPCSRAETTQTLERSHGSIHIRDLQKLSSISDLGACSHPLNLLTDSRDDRRANQLAVFRCMQGNFPDGALVRVYVPKMDDLGLGLYVSTPEFTFIQLASTLNIWELIELGFEFCGRYTSANHPKEGYRHKAPLCTPDKLQTFADSASGITGAKQARLAAKSIIKDSRSLEETHICMLACLPRSLGGMGAKPTLLGQSIELPDAAARILGTRICTPDLYWPDAHIAVEFDSRASTDKQLRAEHDRRKINAYRMMGIDVVSITREDLADPKLIRESFSHINRKCGKRLKASNEKQQAKQAKLLAWLKDR